MSKTLQEIRQQMKRLVEDVNEGGYNQIIELCYADWGDWDGHDDSTEPEEPIYTRYYLHEAGVGGFADLADISKIYENLELNCIKNSDTLTEDRDLALKFDTTGMSYDDEMRFCQDIADIFNAHKYMGIDDWVANFKDL